MGLNKFCLGQSLKTLSQGRVPSSMHIPEPPVDTQWGPSSPRKSSARTEQRICAGGGFSTKLEHLWCKMCKKWGEKWKEQEEVTKDGTKVCQKVTKGGEGDGQRKEKRKKSYYFIWAANDASESFGLTWQPHWVPLFYLRTGIANLALNISGQTGIPHIYTGFYVCSSRVPLKLSKEFTIIK